MARRGRVVLLVFICICVFCIGGASCASAMTSLEITRERSYIQAIEKCFGSMKNGNEVVREYPHSANDYKVGSDDYQVPDRIEAFGGVEYFAPYKGATNKVFWPSGLTPEYTNKEAKENSDSASSCRNFIWSSADGFSGNLWTRYDVPEPKSTSSNLDELMSNVGYKRAESSTTSTCFRIKYSYNTYYGADVDGDDGADRAPYKPVNGQSGEAAKNFYIPFTYCAHVDSDGYLTQNSFEITDIGSGYKVKDGDDRGISLRFVVENSPVYFELRNKNDNNWIDAVFAPNCTTDEFYDDSSRCASLNNGNDDNMVNTYADDHIKWTDVLSDLKDVVSKFTLGTSKDNEGYEFSDGTACTGGGIFSGHFSTRYTCYYDVSIELDGSTGAAVNDWVLDGSRSIVAKKAAEYFKKNSSIKTLPTYAIQKGDKVVLYQYYVTRVGGYSVSCDDDHSSDAGYAAIKWWTEPTKQQNCWIFGALSDTTTKYSLVDGSGLFSSQGTISDVVDFLNSFSDKRLSAISQDDLDEANSGGVIVPTKEPGGDEDEVVEPTCSNSAGALGWILCPIMEGVADASESAYEDYIEPSLRVEPQLLSGNGASGTLTAWGYFRDTANVIIIGFLLFVIFSQVTGFGIDNYGIKKSLPKLVAAGILTNFSYIISQIFVDVSNISGNGVSTIFQNLSNSVGMNTVTVGGASVSFGTTALSSIAILVGLVAGIGMLISAISANGIAIILPIFICVISVGISIATLFAILAIRQAGVLMLVIASPLAFICYALPNTKKIFSRWLTALKAMLIVYPISSALVTGGSFVSKLILSTGSGQADFFMALTAMIVGIAPVFFIPTLLKSSMSALGNIGARMSGIGRGLKASTRRNGAKATNALRNTSTVKGLNNRMARKFNSGVLDKAKNGKTRFSRGLAAVAGYTMGSQKRVANANKADIDEKRAKAAEARWADSGYFSRMSDRVDRENALAGIAEEDRMNDELVKQEAAMLKSGSYEMSDGSVLAVNISDEKSLNNAHSDALKALATSATPEEKAKALAKVKALQNQLSKTDKGMDIVAGNLHSAASRYGSSAISSAAAHIVTEHGGSYKKNDRGAMAMASDIAGGKSVSSSMAEYRSDSIRSYKTTDVDGLGDAAFDEICSLASGGDQTAAKLAYDTLNDPDVKLSPKKETSLVSAAAQYVVSEEGMYNEADGSFETVRTMGDGSQLISDGSGGWSSAASAGKKFISESENKDRTEKAEAEKKNQEIIDNQNRLLEVQHMQFQSQHLENARKVGVDSSGHYPVPPGYKATSDEHIYEDAYGHRYNASTNEFPKA